MNKNILFFMIVAVALSVAGCKTKRTLTASSATRTDETARTDETTTQRESRDSTGTRTEETTGTDERTEDSETEIRVTEYDTSKPVDERTGRPPVARETVTTKRTQSRDVNTTTGKRTEGSTLAEQLDRDSRTATERQTSGTAATEVRETRKRKTVLWPWWLVAAGAAFVVGWRVWKKR